MRIEGGVKPLLAEGRRVRPAENFGDLGKCLIIINDGTTAAEIVADQMAHELDQSLSVAQDPRFQGVAQNRIRNNQGQDRRDPARQKNRKNNLETIEMMAPSFRCWISQLHACLLRKNWRTTVNLLALSGKGECHVEGGLHGRRRDYQTSCSSN